MLKLLTNRLFSPEQYQHMKRIAIGVRSYFYDPSQPCTTLLTR
jgi:hypothetical protein